MLQAAAVPKRPTRKRRRRTISGAELGAILDAIRHIVRDIRVTARAAEKRLGLSGAQLFVLRTLASGDGLSLGELAARTFTHQSSVSVVVSRLVDAGLVERRRARDDRRRLRLALTLTGRARLAAAPAPAQDTLIAAVSRLSDADRRALARSLTRLVAALGVGKSVAPMLLEDAVAPSRRRGRRAGRTAATG